MRIDVIAAAAGIADKTARMPTMPPERLVIRRDAVVHLRANQAKNARLYTYMSWARVDSRRRARAAAPRCPQGRASCAAGRPRCQS